ncbi:MAG TPA: hypothetical protein VK640_17150, partial [Actinomycetes bacterium]|nr:hypothetical protein [Actinomycetes bacterium]
MAEPAGPGRPDGPVGPTRGTWRRSALSLTFLVLAVAAFAWALAGQWSQVVDRLADQEPVVLVGSLGLALVGVFVSFLLWCGTLGTLGSTLPV